MFYIGLYIGYIYYLDFNSSYPNVARNPLPVGKPLWTNYMLLDHICTESSIRLATYINIEK